MKTTHWSSEPVIVTGGGGFIGKHLIRKLLDRRFEVKSIDRVPRPRELPRASGLRYYRSDLRNIAVHFKSSPGTGLIHLAANTSVQNSIQRPLLTLRANVEATCRMLDYARKIDSKRFVFASTAAIYGDKKTSCREEDTPSPLSPYAASKLAAEHYCKVYSSLYRIPTVVLRYFNVYGTGQSSRYAGVITRFVKEAIHGKPPVIFGDGRQTRDFVFIDDVTEATIAALTHNLPGMTTLNIGSGTGTSIVALARTILQAVGMGHLKPIHDAARVGEVRHSRADISAARKMIQFRPHFGLTQGLRPTINWLRKMPSLGQY